MIFHIEVVMSLIFRLFLVFLLLGLSTAHDVYAQGARTILVNFFRDIPASDVTSARVIVFGDGVQLRIEQYGGWRQRRISTAGLRPQSRKRPPSAGRAFPSAGGGWPH